MERKYLTPPSEVEIAEEKNKRLQRFLSTPTSPDIAAFAGHKEKMLSFVAQGDSWFHYPSLSKDVIQHLDPYAGSNGDDYSPYRSLRIMNLAHYGEAMTSMTGQKKLHELKEMLQGRELGKVDGILFSGGGNDLAGDQFRIWLEEAENVGGDLTKALNAARVRSILGVVKAGYEDLIALRDKYAPRVPIFAHSYAHAFPDGRKHICAGPWLQPGFHDRGWNNDEKNLSVVRELLEQFAGMLSSFEGDAFIHINVQNELPKKSDWDNELHPTGEGFKRVADAFRTAIDARLR